MTALDRFVADAIAAARAPDPVAATYALMTDRFADPQVLDAALPEPTEETLLHEDEAVSVWHTRFEPDTVIPPHDHAMETIIGVYRGRERNTMWPVLDGRARPGPAIDLGPGDVRRLDPRAVHSVVALDGAASFGLHVYLGPLTRIERTLYDPDTGRGGPLTEAAFAAAVRPAP